MTLKHVVDFLKTYPFAIICGILFLGCLVVIVLRGDVVGELERKEIELNRRMRVIEKNEANARNLGEHVGEMEGLVDSVRERLFRRRERSINTSFFYSLEEGADIRVGQVNQLPKRAPVHASDGPRELQLYEAIEYEVTFRGTFKEVLRFLAKLHSVDAWLRVSNVQLSSGGGVGPGDLSARVRLIVLGESP